MSLKLSNRSGEERIFLRNARDYGQRRKELWLCAKGFIKMCGMTCSVFHFASRDSLIVTQQKNKLEFIQ